MSADAVFSWKTYVEVMLLFRVWSPGQPLLIKGPEIKVESNILGLNFSEYVFFYICALNLTWESTYRTATTNEGHLKKSRIRYLRMLFLRICPEITAEFQIPATGFLRMCF